ncbi:hypothetical protein FRC00_012629 [Tulasnella sp. 408]|nr:hypothetical protein FRC00_012629 [Tulasnella sp. 408]
MVMAYQDAGWTSLTGLDNLVNSMHQDAPEQRPTIHDVENRLRELIKTSTSDAGLEDAISPSADDH